jgi:hypothetical protein
MTLLAGNGLRFKPHQAEVTPGTAGCVPALAAKTLPLAILAPMPIPVPTNSAAILVIDGEKGAKGFLTKVARIIKSPVAVQGGDRGHFGLVQLKIK